MGRRSNRDRQTAQSRKARPKTKQATHKEKSTRKISHRRLCLFQSLSFSWFFGVAPRLMWGGGLLHSFSSFQSFHASPIHPPAIPSKARCLLRAQVRLPSIRPVVSRLLALLFFPSLCFFVCVSLSLSDCAPGVCTRLLLLPPSPPSLPLVDLPVFDGVWVVHNHTKQRQKRQSRQGAFGRGATPPAPNTYICK